MPFFYQLLLPIGDTSLNDNGPWMNCYFDFGKFTNFFMRLISVGLRVWTWRENVTAPELVHYNGTLVQDVEVTKPSDVDFKQQSTTLPFVL